MILLFRQAHALVKDTILCALNAPLSYQTPRSIPKNTLLFNVEYWWNFQIKHDTTILSVKLHSKFVQRGCFLFIYCIKQYTQALLYHNSEVILLLDFGCFSECRHSITILNSDIHFIIISHSYTNRVTTRASGYVSQLCGLPNQNSSTL